jgi:glycosyltransferase involved in cell wall biosynthesis
MQVCHITSVHPRYDTRVFVKECCSLAKAGYDTTLVVADGQGDEKVDGVKIVDAGMRHANRLKRFMLTSWKVYKVALEQNAQLYHFHDSELMFVSYLLKKKGKKVVYDVHEDLPRQILGKSYMKPWLRKLLSALMEKVEDSMSKKYDAIVTVTEHISKRFSTLNKEVVILFNYPFVSEVEELPPWSERKQAYCYVGSISKVRGVEELVQAAGYTDATLMLGGKFVSKELAQKVQAIPAWGKVDFLGFLSRKEVVKLLSASKVGMVNLHPIINYVDALPVKMFEYMLAGIPVVTSDVPLWKAIVDEEECGVAVDPFDVEKMAAAIDDLLADDKKAEQMGLNGRKAVLCKYNWTQEEKKLFNLYDKLLKS